MKSRVLAIFFGCLFALVCAEVCLRILPQLQTPDRAESPSVSSEKPSILFVGASYTAGVFVRQETRFTERLKKKLGDTWEVRNISRGGLNTRDLLSRIYEIKPPFPKIVFIMAGQPNAWNNNGFGEYEKETGTLSLGSRLAGWLPDLRIVKFGRYAIFQMNRLYAGDPKKTEDTELNESFFYEKTARLLNEELDTKPDLTPSQEAWMRSRLNEMLQSAPQPLFHMARLALNSKTAGKDDEILHDLNALTRTGTQFNSFAYDIVKRLPKRDTWEPLRIFLEEKLNSDPALRWFTQTLGNPDLSALLADTNGSNAFERNAILNFYKSGHAADFGWRRNFFTTGIDLMRYRHETRAACDLLRNQIQFYPVPARIFWGRVTRLREKCDLEPLLEDLIKKNEAEEVQAFLLPENLQELQNWRRYDLAKMVNFFRSKGSLVVLQTFLPSREKNTDKLENVPVRQVAQEENVLLLDHFQRFVQKYPDVKARDFIYLQGSYKGTNDDHFSSEGHELVAEDILNFLKEKNLL